MKLWILKAREDLPDDDNPWEPWYGTIFGLVVRAESEDSARKLAHSNSGPESSNTSNTNAPWLDSKYSSCDKLTSTGEEEVLLIDRRPG